MHMRARAHQTRHLHSHNTHHTNTPHRFLQSITDAPILVRNGVPEQTETFLDAQTQSLTVAMVAFSPEHGLASTISITASLGTETTMSELSMSNLNPQAKDFLPEKANPLTQEAEDGIKAKQTQEELEPLWDKALDNNKQSMQTQAELHAKDLEDWRQINEAIDRIQKRSDNMAVAKDVEKDSFTAMKLIENMGYTDAMKLEMQDKEAKHTQGQNSITKALEKMAALQAELVAAQLAS